MNDPKTDSVAAVAPFLKWAGGKTQLLSQLDRFFPEMISDYSEPFIGGGAVFFFLRGQGRLTGDITLADVNEELINAYRAVQQDLAMLLSLLERHRTQHSKEVYYGVRAQGYTPDTVGAARTIYLNKTGFNGLYRVNRQGKFNVPLGDYKNPSVYEEASLRKASLALQGVKLTAQSFHETLAAAKPGSLVYLDPPYVPLSETSSFTDYVPGGFGLRDQEALAASIRDAHERGVQFVLSNSYTDIACRLYSGFEIERVSATRRINSVGTKRGNVEEAIVYNRVR